MPAVSNNVANMAPEGAGDWGDLTIDFAKFPPHNLAPLLKGLPDDRCQCPHWGVLFTGKIVVRYADHEETIEAGQAFYMPPGHVPEALEDCELVQFSPTGPRREVVEAMARNAQAMAPASSAPLTRLEAVEIVRRNAEAEQLPD
jgi:hypothetical protein